MRPLLAPLDPVLTPKAVPAPRALPSAAPAPGGVRAGWRGERDGSLKKSQLGEAAGGRGSGKPRAGPAGGFGLPGSARESVGDRGAGLLGTTWSHRAERSD